MANNFGRDTTSGNALYAAQASAARTSSKRSESWIRSVWKLPIFWILIIVSFVLLGSFGSWLPVDDPSQVNLSSTFIPPFVNAEHPLGTDQLGRDIFSRILHGAQASFLVAVGGVAVTSIIGTSLGISAGYFGSTVDMLISRLVDIVLALPGILAVLPIIAAFGPSLTNLILVLALIGWGQYARLIRSETLSIRERDYIIAARVVGCGSGRILVRHVLPNVVNSLIVLVSFSFGTVIVFESAISFLGLGIQPPSVSWGLMLADSRPYLTSAWWFMIPGFAITITVLSFNMVGDWLRIRLDPRQAHHR